MIEQYKAGRHTILKQLSVIPHYFWNLIRHPELPGSNTPNSRYPVERTTSDITYASNPREKKTRRTNAGLGSLDLDWYAHLPRPPTG